jgi:AcrR family transcriptional regulator
VDENRGPARRRESVEGDQMGTNPESRFAWQEDVGGEASVADLCLSAVFKRLASIGAGEARKRADRKPTGVEYAPPCKLEADPVDAWQRGTIDCDDAPGEANSDGRGAVARERARGYAAVEDKQECLLAAVDALVEPTIALIERAEDAGTGEARLRQAVEAFLGLAARQPAASKVIFVEIYAAGREGEAAVEGVLDTFEHFGVSQLNEIPGRKGTPPQMVRAMLGGFQKVIQKRLYSDEADQLPRLAEDIATWGLSYPPPPGPLEGPRRRGRKAKSFAERQAVAHPPERVLRAFAAIVSEKGYTATTVAEVVERAGTSQRVFYGHFENKEDAFLSALDSGSAQMLASVLPAFRRAKTWQESVRAAYEAMFSFGIEEPEYTQLGAVEMYTVGRRALRTRDTVMEGLEALLVPGYELMPDTPPIAAEAIGGAIYALIYNHVKNNGPESLPELAPMATYMTLALFIGAKQAFERAMEESEKW